MLNLKVNFQMKWYEGLLWAVEIGLVAFGLWALVDTLMISCSKAAWRFLLLFLIWALPGAAVLVFFRPGRNAQDNA
ncbi:MAG: hypothetical protein HY014_14595 [Acidobacteria bacterium]|nr:hypothetical protein [Acidobacteriota bacterium]MBI3489389.1 hypothetical protein [Acidobacteriota bacterium]